MTYALELTPDRTQNNEPCVGVNFGPGVPQDDQSAVHSMMYGYGLSCGWGPGPYSDAVKAAKRLAARLRRLGWSVAVQS